MSDKVYFKTKSGYQLCGILEVPKVGTGKAVILCHGFSSSKDSDKYKILSKLFVKEGVAALRFDFFGHGESEGDFSKVTVSQGVDDVLSALDFMEGLGFVDIGLLGVSFGGKCSLVAAAKSRRIKVLSLVAPAVDYAKLQKAQYGDKKLKEWKEHGKIVYEGKEGAKELEYTFHADLKNFNFAGLAKHVEVPTLIIHGDRDQLVPVEHSQKLFKELACFKKLEVIIGCNHFFERDSDREQLYYLIVEWIVRYL